MNRPYITLYQGKRIEKNRTPTKVGAQCAGQTGEAHKVFWGPALFYKKGLAGCRGGAPAGGKGGKAPLRGAGAEPLPGVQGAKLPGRVPPLQFGHKSLKKSDKP